MTKKNPNAAWGLVSVIVTELVAAPAILGGLAYFLMGYLSKRYSWDKSVQLITVLFAALTGMVIAFYRINQISKEWDDDSTKP